MFYRMLLGRKKKTKKKPTSQALKINKVHLEID